MNTAYRHPDFIITFLNIFKPKSYLELGLYEGEVFKQVCTIVPHCVGVDTIDRKIECSGKINILSTDDFFENNKDTFDFIFIDADHNYESVKKDLVNSLKVLNKHGVIILHDTDPSDPKYYDKGYCGDAYKIVEYIKTKRNDLDILTLPISHEGLSIVKRNIDRRVN